VNDGLLFLAQHRFTALVLRISNCGEIQNSYSQRCTEHFGIWITPLRWTI